MVATKRNRSGRGRIAVKVTIIAVTMLALGEVLARAFLTLPSAQDPDDELGWRWSPGAIIFNGSEGGARIRINALGLVDQEVGDKRGRIRLLGFGNSFMEAIQVPLEANYTSRTEALVPEVEFVNLARSAMTPAHYPVVLRRWATRLQPDLLVVSLGLGDIAHLMDPNVTVTRDEAGRIRDIHVPVEAADKLKATFDPLLRHSALATYMMRRLKPVISKWLWPAPAPQAQKDAWEDPRTWRLGGERLAAILTQMKGTAPVVALEVPYIAYGPGREAHFGEPQEREAFERAAREAGVPLVDAGPAMIAHYRATGEPSNGFQNHRIGAGHLNETGHRVVAETLAAWLRAEVVARRQR